MFLLFGFLFAVSLGMVIIPRILVISHKKRLYDVPDARKVHTMPVPRLGGLSFFPVILMSMFLVIGFRLYFWDMDTSSLSFNMLYEYLFLFVGMVPQTGLVKDMVDCDKAGYIKVNEKMETNVPGLYAAGDCTQTFLRQVVTSAADGAVAAVASERYVKELEQIQGILGPDSGRTVFLFYNPYSNEEIEKTAQLEQELSGQWRVYRQDVTRQSLLYNSLKLERTVAGAFYDNGKLVEIKQAF